MMLIASPFSRINPEYEHVPLSACGLRSGMRQINSDERGKRFAIKYGESFNSAINDQAPDEGAGGASPAAINRAEGSVKKNGCRDKSRGRCAAGQRMRFSVRTGQSALVNPS
jgi:hypothetical protein